VAELFQDFFVFFFGGEGDFLGGGDYISDNWAQGLENFGSGGDFPKLKFVLVWVG